MEHIINIINQILCYSDPTVTDNPQQQAFNHTRRLQSLAVKNPQSNNVVVAPGQSFQVFDYTVSTNLTGSTLSLSASNSAQSIYRLTSSSASAFKTRRSVSGLSACTVSQNNGAMAIFDFTGATLTSVQVGDILRISGQSLNDSGTFSFNPLNSGKWKVIGVSGTEVSVVKPVGEYFTAVPESVPSVGPDVQFYADDLVQEGHKIDIRSVFSPVTRRVYEISQVAPGFVEFTSASPLPLESGLTYTANSIVVYESLKRVLYIETDQEASVRVNGDTSDSNKLTPFMSGDQSLPAIYQKVGDAYDCIVVNKSFNKMNLKFFMAE